MLRLRNDIADILLAYGDVFDSSVLIDHAMNRLGDKVSDVCGSLWDILRQIDKDLETA